MARMSAGMSYEDAMGGGYDCDRADALAEVKKHDLEPADFLAAVGDKATYSTREVLEWLGY